MEYLLIFLFQVLGIGYNVMENIIRIGNSHPGMSKSEVFGQMWNEDWDTLIVSLIVMVTHITVHFSLDYYKMPVTQIEYYLLYSFALALVLGYAGQRLAYKWLGSAEKAIDKKVSDKLG